MAVFYIINIQKISKDSNRFTNNQSDGEYSLSVICFLQDPTRTASTIGEVTQTGRRWRLFLSYEVKDRSGIFGYAI